MVDELWRDISDWPLHQVSNRGRIRALPGAVVGGGPRIAIEAEFRVLTWHNGYPSVKQGRQRHTVHTLMLEAFDRSCPPGMECRHLNGNRSDNRWPENIIWGTPHENHQDTVRHGTGNRPFGENHGMAKLTKSEVDYVRVQEGYHGINADLARKFCVTGETIRHIRKGLIWRREA